MSVALWLLALQGVLGAADTAYYHEWRARLPARPETTAPELKLHAVRDFLYAALFLTLPWRAWQGWFLVALAAIIAAEIVLTLTDFVVEIQVRKSLGDVYAGERVMHAVMGILYGAMAAYLLPAAAAWRSQPTALAAYDSGVPELLKWAITAMGLGVLLSGLRDLYAAYDLPGGGWPWK